MSSKTSAEGPRALPFGPSVLALRAVQHLPLVLTLDAYGGSLTPALSPLSPGPLVLGPKDQGLRTPPLPVTHAWVGYGWQNSRLYHLVRVQQLHEQPRVAPAGVRRRSKRAMSAYRRLVFPRGRTVASASTLKIPTSVLDSVHSVKVVSMSAYSILCSAKACSHCD